MVLVNTPTARDVISDSGGDNEIVAADAHQIARISYRQLDHWARQGWVRPSLDPGLGRSGKRLYAPGDVIRLDLLRYLAVSKVNAAVAGPAVAEFDVPDGDVRVLWGPVGSKEPGEPGLIVVPADKALAQLEDGGAFVVYNPAEVRRRIALTLRSTSGQAGQVAERAARQERRSA
jgi:hypothetical protein